MSTKLDMSQGAITERLRIASALSDLTAERRLDAKLDMSPSGITKRLREASDLLDLCRKLAQSHSGVEQKKPGDATTL